MADWKDLEGFSTEMTKDLMRYDLITQEAMRTVVRKCLERAATDGLPGEHHFFINFVTGAKGVEISDTLKSLYPDEMTIVLQHQFWGLEVSEDRFSVSLTFNKVPEALTIPFSAVRSFYDPSVQFGLQFSVEGYQPVAAETDAGPGSQSAPDESARGEEASDEPVVGEVVSLDAFRKK
jgi:hypothetical protein